MELVRDPIANEAAASRCPNLGGPRWKVGNVSNDWHADWPAFRAGSGDDSLSAHHPFESDGHMIYICGLAEMPEHVRSLQPSHLVSLLTAVDQPPTPEGFAAERHHRVEVNDISVPMLGYVLPQDDHIAGLIAFLDGWDAGAPLLVHCFAGISRSTAAALIALTFRHDGREEEAALKLRRAAPHAKPNRRMIELADARLERDGRLIAALAAMGEAALRPYGPLVRVDPLG